MASLSEALAARRAQKAQNSNQDLINTVDVSPLYRHCIANNVPMSEYAKLESVVRIGKMEMSAALEVVNKIARK